MGLGDIIQSRNYSHSEERRKIDPCVEILVQKISRPSLKVFIAKEQ